MNKAEYQQTQNNVLMVASVVNELKLDEFIEAIRAAQTVAPVVDPTLYQKAGSNLQNINQLAWALKSLQQKLDEIEFTEELKIINSVLDQKRELVFKRY